MADSQHLEFLRKGVVAWNAWRTSNPDVRPDLSGANLAGAYLARANLAEADLRRAVLNGVTFRAADLYRADLHGADLIGADLRGADLEGADLGQADLGESDLSRADLKRADFTRARLERTVLVACDLHGAIGLDTCIHYRSSTIDHRTIYGILRHDALPVVFLRGCGLPDPLIDFYLGQQTRPAEFPSCFISYATEDEPFASRLHTDLQNAGVRCWFAPDDIEIGGGIRDSIHEAIKTHEKLLLILSRHSLASHWVANEVEAALERERQSEATVLLPLRLDDSILQSHSGWAADIRRGRQMGDFRHWAEPDSYQRSLQRLLRDLQVT